MTFDDYCNLWYETACDIADIVIQKWIKNNCTSLDESFDLENVRSVAVIDSLEKSFSKYDPDNAYGASVKTFLSNVVRNTVLSELKKASTADRRAQGGFKPRPDKLERYRRCYPSLLKNISSNRGNSPAVEAHTYQYAYGAVKRKEELLAKLPEYLRRLAPEDQVILSFWCEDERTYIARSIEYLGLEDNKLNRNNISLRRNRAIERLGKMMKDLDVDYREVRMVEDSPMRIQQPKGGDASLPKPFPGLDVTPSHGKAALYKEKADKLYSKESDYEDVAEKLYGKLYGD